MEAARAGAGIGTCHDFVTAGAAGLVRLFPDRSVTRSYRVVWNENMRGARGVQSVADLPDRIVRKERRLCAAS